MVTCCFCCLYLQKLLGLLPTVRLISTVCSLRPLGLYAISFYRWLLLYWPFMLTLLGSQLRVAVWFMSCCCMLWVIAPLLDAQKLLV